MWYTGLGYHPLYRISTQLSTSFIENESPDRRDGCGKALDQRPDGLVGSCVWRIRSCSGEGGGPRRGRRARSSPRNLDRMKVRALSSRLGEATDPVLLG
jgi:hypothetical protein